MNTSTLQILLTFVVVTTAFPLSKPSTFPSTTKEDELQNLTAPGMKKNLTNINQIDLHKLKLEENLLQKIFHHVIGKRNVYDTIAGSRAFLSSNEAGNIQQRIERLRQLQRLERKHRRFLHGAPLSIGLALPVLSRNINTPAAHASPYKR